MDLVARLRSADQVLAERASSHPSGCPIGKVEISSATPRVAGLRTSITPSIARSVPPGDRWRYRSRCH
jgi:hypothetical protein